MRPPIRRATSFRQAALGLSVAGSWDGLRLRANASAPMTLEDCEIPSELRLTQHGAGFKVMLEIALPPFNLGAAAVALGLCRVAVAGTAAHLKSARFEHLGQSLGESLPTLRAQLAATQIDTTDSRRASTTSSITSSGRGRRRCCAC
jgi:alkylation response protein AidB-like acyl-CoA dehydrogenase